MLDIKLIRENPELVRQGLLNKNSKDIVDEILALDEERRSLILKTDELKAKRNQASAQIPQMKKAGQDTSAVFAEMKLVGDQIALFDSQLREIEEKSEMILRHTPNLSHTTVPIGKTAEDNVETKQWLPDGFSFERPDCFILFKRRRTVERVAIPPPTQTISNSIESRSIVTSQYSAVIRPCPPSDQFVNSFTGIKYHS